MADAIQIAQRKGNTNYQGTAAGNESNEQLVAQGLPPYTEMVRLGRAWSVMSVVAVAGLIVRPSGTAAFEIWNGYPTGGPSLVIDRLFWFNLVTITGVGNGFLGWAEVSAAKAAPAAGANVVTRGSSGRAYGGPVIAALGTTVTDSGWFPWATGGRMTGDAAVTPSGGAVADVHGRLIVPPQCSLGMHAVSPTTAATFTQGASWYEVQLTLE